MSLPLLKQKPINLSDEQIAAIKQVIVKHRLDWEPRVEDMTIEQIVQPFFTMHDVLYVVSELPMPSRSLTLAQGYLEDGVPQLLSQQLDRLQAIADVDQPEGLDQQKRAYAYAHYANEWTSPALNGEMKLEKFDHIPWYELSDAEKKDKEELRKRFANIIKPEQVSKTKAGWQVHYWLVADRQLIERKLVVPEDGKLERHDLVHVPELAVPEGKFWDTVDGRWVPVG